MANWLLPTSRTAIDEALDLIIPCYRGSGGSAAGFHRFTDARPDSLDRGCLPFSMDHRGGAAFRAHIVALGPGPDLIGKIRSRIQPSAGTFLGR